jgi:hypothetical protein
MQKTFVCTRCILIYLIILDVYWFQMFNEFWFECSCFSFLFFGFDRLLNWSCAFLCFKVSCHCVNRFDRTFIFFSFSSEETDLPTFYLFQDKLGAMTCCIFLQLENSTELRIDINVPTNSGKKNRFCFVLIWNFLYIHDAMTCTIYTILVCVCLW